MKKLPYASFGAILIRANTIIIKSIRLALPAYAIATITRLFALPFLRATNLRPGQPLDRVRSGRGFFRKLLLASSIGPTASTTPTALIVPSPATTSSSSGQARAILYESLADNFRVEANLEEEKERKDKENKSLIKL
ncbi:uncharacterized protein RAG0_06921 [Rhynchosporium agropyri]|uniref:Uncharacterized protein n=1 Tax=Rhynchosporium agropyri TaxID=914238 RepID=A0A1E1KMD9_9HELO|nr:uncharacterized protein RAG0_06921 [Rhynchosporium agropyri]